jgi:hypothetical protein
VFSRSSNPASSKHRARGDLEPLGELVDKQRQGLEELRDIDLDAFHTLIRPLERVARRNLRGEGRDACLHAFRTHPDPFARLCDEALDRGRNPLALLSKMVFDGDHELEPPASADLGSATIPDEPDPIAEAEPSVPIDESADSPTTLARELPAEAQELLERLRRGTLVEEMPAC